MIKDKKIVALIPARGGSRGVPGKNKKLFCNKPLIVWTVLAAKQSRYLDRVIVSSDDREIMKIAEENGADVPFQRPSAISDCGSTAYKVINHALEFLKSQGELFDTFIYLQPTSPLRRADHIDRAIEYYCSKNAKSVVSITGVESYYLMNRVPESLNLFDFIGMHNVNRQEAEASKPFMVNGAIYISEVENMLQSRTWYGKDSYGFVMDKVSSTDINDEVDFQIAEFLMKKYNRKLINGC